jgi:hypothetical protein
MRRDSAIQLMAVGVLVAALGASSVLAVQLTASGGRHRLGYTDTAVEGQPPQVALGIAMGAFRGIFVNFLWIRANQLKEDGRYYEALDLSKAITTLQPRFPHVWAFHAWNMAYNISVNSQTPQERWKWVNAGIHLLRSQGVVHNPNDLLVHKELAWLFLHKIGGYMDDANLHYKRQLAGEWSLVLGPPPLADAAYKDREKAKEKYIAWLRPIADAPERLEVLYQQAPETRALVERLRRELNVEPDWRVNQNYIVLQTIAQSGLRSIFERHFAPEQTEMMAMIEDPDFATAWPALLAHIRKRVLIEDYKMEPERMITLTRKYGPLDWRHWGSHGLYWSTRGVDNALTRVSMANRKDFDFLNANRVAVQSLQELWRTGDIYFDLMGYIRDPDDPAVFWRGSPNVHFIEAYGENLEEFIDKAYKDGIQFEGKHRAYSMLAAGYENFRKDAIRFLYRRGEKELAAKMKDELAVWPYHNTNDPDRRPLFAMNIDDFVKKELEDQLTRPSVAREEIVGSLHGAFVNGLLANNTELFRAQVDYARMVHFYFFERQGRRTMVAREASRMAQIDERFPVVVGSEFAGLMRILSIDDAERMYDAAPADLKVWAYDIIQNDFKPRIDAMERDGGRPFAKIFPEPEGLAQHRQEMERLFRERQQRPEIEMK